MTLPARFPVRTLRADTIIYRIHRAAFSPWWFSDDGSGRFDPVGSGQGACYFAERPLGAWIEVFRKQLLLAEPAVGERRLQQVALGRPVKLADLTSRRGLQFGVSAELGAAGDYAAGHQFARDAVAVGFAGVRHWLRHDPRQSLAGIALFAPAGTPVLGDPDWPLGHDHPIPDDLVEAARRAYDYRVLPIP